MLRGRNGGKGEREQHFEGVTIVCLVMCIESRAVSEGGDKCVMDVQE